MREILLDMRDLIGDISERLEKGEIVEIFGEGKSMFPFIDGEKDKIVLENIKGRKLRAGEIYLYRKNDGRYAVHRAYRIDGDSVAMLGDGQVSIEYGIPKKNIAAVVRAVIKPNRRVDCIKHNAVFLAFCKMKLRIFIHRCTSKIKKIFYV